MDIEIETAGKIKFYSIKYPFTLSKILFESCGLSLISDCCYSFFTIEIHLWLLKFTSNSWYSFLNVDIHFWLFIFFSDSWYTFLTVDIHFWQSIFISDSWYSFQTVEIHLWLLIFISDCRYSFLTVNIHFWQWYLFLTVDIFFWLLIFISDSWYAFLTVDIHFWLLIFISDCWNNSSPGSVIAEYAATFEDGDGVTNDNIDDAILAASRDGNFNGLGVDPNSVTNNGEPVMLIFSIQTKFVGRSGFMLVFNNISVIQTAGWCF